MKKAMNYYTTYARAHLDALIEHGCDRYGKHHSPMWVAALDLDNMQYPENPLAQSGRRAYRDIHAPYGSNLYMDLPQIVAAQQISDICGELKYTQAAQAYTKSYLEKCTSENGLFLWGHHFYYDVFADQIRNFVGGQLDGSKHEMRPHSAPWDLLYQWMPEHTIQELQALSMHTHKSDGSFDRHAAPPDGLPETAKGCAFIEAGAVLISSLHWHAKKTDKQSSSELAKLISQWTHAQRNENTGLLRNKPGKIRWDYHVCTSEIGVWSEHLLEAYHLSGDQFYLDIADQALSAWLQHAWDDHEQRYAGMTRIIDGSHERTIDTDYQPRAWSDIWFARFPSHDYPLTCADTCVQLFELTAKPIYKTAIERWAKIIKKSPIPTVCKDGHGAYAEVFGRAIRFLCHAHRATQNNEYFIQAQTMADLAIKHLWSGSMFRGHLGEQRYDAVDGVGWLLLALIELDQKVRLPTYGLCG